MTCPPSASSRNLVSAMHASPFTPSTVNETLPLLSIEILMNFSRIALLPLLHGERDGPRLLFLGLLERVALLLARDEDALVRVALVQLLDELLLRRAVRGLDAPPVGDELVRAVGLLDHADVVLAHVDRDLGVDLGALVAAHEHLLLGVGLGEGVLEIFERALERHQVRDLEVALR